MTALYKALKPKANCILSRIWEVSFLAYYESPILWIRPVILVKILQLFIAMKASFPWSVLSLWCSLASALDSLRRSSVVIVGAGPAGLASALMLESHGCSDITVIEKRSKASFESEKAYLYMLAPNGQLITDYLNKTRRIADQSVSSYNFSTLKVVEPNAEVKVKQVPLRTVGKEKFWLPRSALLDSFLAKVKSVNAAERRKSKQTPINLQFDSTCETMEVDGDGKVQVTTITNVRKISTFAADVVIGCDGVNSVVRKWLASAYVQNRTDRAPLRSTFHSTKFASDSAGLRYKIFTLKPDFLLPAEGLRGANLSQPLRAEQKSPAPPEHVYSIRSIPGTRKSRFFLGLLPVRAGVTRTANVVCLPEHEIWSLRNGTALKSYLQRCLPQLDIDDLLTNEELERFAASPGGLFPSPQYCDGMYKLFYSPSRGEGTASAPSAATSAVMLAGDAVHAFPPDLGQGVNSALEDVYALHRALERNNASLEAALAQYEAERLPEAIALCKLMVFGYPYQYNQSPRLRKLWLLNAALRMGLHKLAPALFAPPAFQMVQNYDLTYQEVLRRAHRTTFNLAVVVAALAGVVAFGVKWLARRVCAGL